MSSRRLPIKLLVKPDNTIDIAVTRKVNAKQLANITELDKRLNNPGSLPNPWFSPKKSKKGKRV